MADIEVIADETVLSCSATGVTITVEFDVAVSSAGASGATVNGAEISGDNRYSFRRYALALGFQSVALTSPAALC